jgi:hypothetical protein
METKMSKYKISTLLLLLVFTLIFSGQNRIIYASGEPWGPAPTYDNPISPFVQEPSLLSPTSRGFCYSLNVTPYGPTKFFLNTPGTLVNMVSASNDVFAATWANGHWYGVVYPSNQLTTIDTSTGTRTTIGTMTISGTAEALCWDPTTNSTYLLTTSPANLYSVNLGTGTATLVAPVTGPVNGIIEGGFSNTGVLYAIELQTTANSNLGIINKATGVWTTVGSTGVVAAYAQGSSFDRSDGTYYWASFTYNPLGPGILKTINLSSGATTTIGTFQGNDEVGGFVIPSLPAPSQAHDISVGPFMNPLPYYIINTSYGNQTAIQNVGLSNETGIPIKWFINGT